MMSTGLREIPDTDAETGQTPGTVLATNIRKLRASMKMTQARLAKKAGLPRATVALLESKRSNPSINSVVAIARAMGVGVDDLMNEVRASSTTIVKRADKRPTEMAEGRFMSTVVSPINSKHILMQEISMMPGCSCKGKPHPIGSQEYFLCNEGDATVVVDGDANEVKAGDLIFFQGNLPHFYHNRTNRPVHAFSVVVYLD
ncbi:MAG: XRE family transcriptional regulator [Nitrospinota bacterium]